MKEKKNKDNTNNMKKKKKYVIIAMIFTTIVLLHLIYLSIPNYYFSNSNEIIIFDANGEKICQFMNEKEGEYLKLEEIKEDFVAAFIASEDASFYEHNGFSLKGIVRSLYGNIKNNTKHGGSTISQQLSRILFLNNEKSIQRKIKEGLITMQLESNYTKKEIIENYLNNIYLGHDIYGIEQASKYYFNKTNKELSLNEVAMIVGVASAPNIYAPDVNYEKAFARKNYVLKRLLKEKYINNDVYEKLIKENVEIKITQKENPPYYIPIYNYIRRKLSSLGLYEKKIRSRGLRVYTTIDNEIQKKVVDIALKNNPQDGSSIGIIVNKVDSGDVLAMCNNYSIEDEYNNVLQSSRPIGSTIKPIIYYLALRANFTPLTKIDCQKTTFNIKEYGLYAPENASKKYAKDKLTLIEAIGISDNIYAVKTLLYLGLENLEHFLELFNIQKECVPSSALGVDSMTLFELASIYTTFANLGIYYSPRIITKIEDSLGKVYYQPTVIKKMLLAKKECLLLAQLLTASFDNNIKEYTLPTLINYKPNYKYAAKTGSDSANAYTIGYNKKYVVGVWTGMANNEPLINKTLAKKNFKEIVNSICVENDWFVKPTYINSKKINPKTGLNDNNGSIYWFAY